MTSSRLPSSLLLLLAQEGDILYEVQIENLMPTPFVLESFRFDPAEGCTVVPCNSAGAVDTQREGDNR